LNFLGKRIICGGRVKRRLLEMPLFSLALSSFNKFEQASRKDARAPQEANQSALSLVL